MWLGSIRLISIRFLPNGLMSRPQRPYDPKRRSRRLGVAVEGTSCLEDGCKQARRNPTRSTQATGAHEAEGLRGEACTGDAPGITVTEISSGESIYRWTCSCGGAGGLTTSRVGALHGYLSHRALSLKHSRTPPPSAGAREKANRG
jgi:hypothetical protein